MANLILEHIKKDHFGRNYLDGYLDLHQKQKLQKEKDILVDIQGEKQSP